MRLLAQLQTLDEALMAWERYRADVPFEQFAHDKDTQYMVYHAMLLSIQASIDLATGIAVMKTPRRPGTYRETFQVLGKSGIIPEGLAEDMSKLAGFRNILVHEYTGLDVTRVYIILTGDFTTMDNFRTIVKKFVKDNRSG